MKATALETRIGSAIEIKGMPPLHDAQRAVEMAVAVAMEAAACSMRMLELARLQLQRARQDKAPATFEEDGWQTH